MPMNSSAYEKMLRELGFKRIHRGMALLHSKEVPTLYFNRKRDGGVYFTAYRKDANSYPKNLWDRLPPQQKKDDDPALLTIIPIAGKECEAFRQFIEGSAGPGGGIRGGVIPSGITRSDVRGALKRLDAGEDHGFGPSTGYDLVFEGKHYPPKAVLALAAERLAGRVLGHEEFSGGKNSQCNRVLTGLEFEIIPKAEDDSKEEWRLEQTSTQAVLDKVFEGAAPGSRRRWESFLGDSLAHALEQFPDRAVAILEPSYVSMTVGMVRCMTLPRADSFIVLLHKKTAPQGMHWTGGAYQYAPGCEEASVPRDATAELLKSLRLAHLQAVDACGEAHAGNSQRRRAHSPGILKYLASVLGRSFPAPTYATVSVGTRDRAQGENRRVFTHYWRSDSWEGYRGKTIPYTAGNALRKSGIAPGSRIFVVTVLNGQVRLGGCLDVAKVVARREAEAVLGRQVYNAEEVALPAAETPFDADRTLPSGTVLKLRFGPERKPLVFRNGRLDQQTLRGVRELSPESVKLLESLLPLDDGAREAQELAADIALAERQDLPETEKTAIRKYRCAQGLFRERVARLEGSCRITGVSDPDLLIASHIKPWALSDPKERQDGDNGLFLAPHVDALFDAGLISFSDEGELLVSRKLDKSVLSAWAISKDRRVGQFRAGQRKYLKWHRDYHKF